MKSIVTTIISLLLMVPVFAQNSSTTSELVPLFVVKTSVEGGMHEIIGQTGKDIFHINKETGEVKLFYYEKYINLSRQESSEDVAEAGKINYQLVISSNEVYLMNINTGVIWYLKSTGLTHSKDKFILITEKK